MIINIAGINFLVKIDKRFKNIINFLEKYYVTKNNKTEPELYILIENSAKRSVSLSDDLKTLKISGNDIDNLNNHYNLSGLLQALNRFASIFTVKQNIFLLHGSCSVYNNKTLCFGDDGKSAAKTISSLECSIKSNKYIGDEFVFLNSINNDIFGFSFIPLHIRPVVIEHLNKFHNFKLRKDLDYGIFLKCEDFGFEFIDKTKLDCFIFTHFNPEKITFEELKGKNKKYAIEVTVVSHVLKLLHPEFDRMNFSKKSDSKDVIEYKSSDIQGLTKKLKIQNEIEKISNIPAFRVFLRTPCDLIKVLNDLTPYLENK
jgi:hypothetical protein